MILLSINNWTILKKNWYSLETGEIRWNMHPKDMLKIVLYGGGGGSKHLNVKLAWGRETYYLAIMLFNLVGKKW